MKNHLQLFLVTSFVIFSVLLLTSLKRSLHTHAEKIIYPKSWPKPVYDFEKNPLTREGINLGRKLFYEPLLSRDNSISCSNCHLSFTSFTHTDHALSHGINDSIGNRNSPVLINLAWGTSFMWDGAVNHLDLQALAPITHRAEMGEDLNNVITKLSGTEEYPRLFKKAFGSIEITGEHLLKAIAQFQLSLVSANSKYDEMKLGKAEFSAQEQRGYKIFQTNCSSCHTEPLFTNAGFANNGLSIDSTLNDLGRMGITGNPADYLLFKVPTLRNIQFSKPYMHDGRFRKLSEVLNHYNKGVVRSSTLDKKLMNTTQMSSNEKVDVVAF